MPGNYPGHIWQSHRRDVSSIAKRLKIRCLALLEDWISIIIIASIAFLAMSFTLISTTNLPQVLPLRFVINIPLGAQAALSTPFAVMTPVPQIERLLAFVFHARNQIENMSVWSCNLPWVYTCLRPNGWQCRTALPRVYPHGAGEIEEAHVQRVSRYISCLQITYPQVLNALQTNCFQVHPGPRTLVHANSINGETRKPLIYLLVIYDLA